MDNTLGALVEQYKAEPSPKLRRMIWNSILSEELAEVLKNISITPESDWFVFDDTIQAKRIVDRKYLVVEVFVRGEAMLGFCCLFCATMRQNGLRKKIPKKRRTIALVSAFPNAWGERYSAVESSAFCVPAIALLSPNSKQDIWSLSLPKRGFSISNPPTLSKNCAEALQSWICSAKI